VENQYKYRETEACRGHGSIDSHGSENSQLDERPAWRADV